MHAAFNEAYLGFSKPSCHPLLFAKVTSMPTDEVLADTCFDHLSKLVTLHSVSVDALPYKDAKCNQCCEAPCREATNQAVSLIQTDSL